MASLGGLFMSKARSSSEKCPYVALTGLKLTGFCLPLLLRAGIKSLHLNTRLLPNHSKFYLFRGVERWLSCIEITALAEDLDRVASTHIKWLTPICILIPRDLMSCSSQ